MRTKLCLKLMARWLQSDLRDWERAHRAFVDILDVL